MARGSQLALATALFGAAHGAVAQQFTFRDYLQRDGLADLAVTCLFQDRAGFLWVCTENGLFRHDGTDFERFGEGEGIENTVIHGAVEDAAGRIWAGTPHGLYVKDGGRFREVRVNGRTLNVAPGQRIAAAPGGGVLVIEDDQLLEVAAPAAGGDWQGHARFTPDQIRAQALLRQLSSVHVEPGGRIWLGCGTRICSADSGGVGSVEAGRVEAFGPQAGVAPDTWSSLYVDRDGRVWARGLKHVAVREPGARQFVLRDPPHSALTSDIQYVPLAEDPDGRILTRTDAGLARWEDGAWREFGAKSGIGSEGITALVASRDGAMWLGRSGRGLSRWLGYGNVESWTTAQGLGADTVWNIVRSVERGVLVATRVGCSRIDAASHRALPCGFEGLPKGEIQLLGERLDGSLWLSMTTGELFRVGAGQRRAILVAKVPNVRQLFEDSRGRLWICTNHGVDVVERGSSRVQPMRLPADLGEVTDAVEDAHGAIWIASQGGLLRWSDRKWTILHIDDERARHGFSSVAAADDDWLWAGSASQGLLHLHVTADRADRTEWVADPALQRAVIYFTHRDARRWIWVGTDAGVALFDGQVWRHFRQQDGLIWNDIDQNSVLVDSDGSVWVGTGAGVTHILQPQRLAQGGPLDLRIGRASLGHATLEPGTQPRLDWEPDASLSVHLADMNFDEPRHSLLKVRLGGLSDTWYETRDHDLHYPGLKPGAYTFEAIALDPDRQRRSEPVRLQFEILPPWWRTAWFQVLLGAAAVAAVVIAWKWRLRKVDDQRKTLERQLAEHEALLVRATRDSLTGLWNRTAILEILAREIETARAASSPLAIVLIDVDHFKHVNDTYGHLAGDEVLRALGAQLASRVRATDFLGRYGGEEFLLVAPGTPRAASVAPFERLHHTINEVPFRFNDVSLRVSASFGVAWLQADHRVVADLLARADAALYEAKNKGRNRVEYALAA